MQKHRKLLQQRAAGLSVFLLLSLISEKSNLSPFKIDKESTIKVLPAPVSPTSEIYGEETKQGLEEPCFFVKCLNPTNKLFLGKRYFRKNSFVVQYFPKSKHSPNAECYEVGEELMQCLEYIPVLDAMLRGTAMNYEVIDGVLNFFVNYDCFVYKVDEITRMEVMQSHRTDVKG